MRITLCGSARFEKEFHEWNKKLTLAGHVVYSLAVFPSQEDEKNWYTPEQKRMLDRVHFKKIENSDAILVLDVAGYIGESTAREVSHAKACIKRIYYLTNPTDLERLEQSTP